MNPAPALEWREVTLDLGRFCVREITLALPPGSWIGILGPTGAGKTLVLEIAAGFQIPTRGRVLRKARDVTRRPPEERGIAYVPQDDLLFPHLDVTGNLRFAGAGRNGASPSASAEGFEEVVEGLGLAHLLGRRIETISGGEAQRVALGRALLASAEVLLLDECTSALDEETRAAVGAFLARQRRERGLSVVQVTHDPEEARHLADRVVHMRAGQLEEIPKAGPLREHLAAEDSRGTRERGGVARAGES